MSERNQKIAAFETAGLGILVVLHKLDRTPSTLVDGEGGSQLNSANARFDPIRSCLRQIRRGELGRIVKEIQDGSLNHPICFTHEQARGGRWSLRRRLLAIQSASPTGKPVGVNSCV
jgi:hypothetical protein